MSGPNKMTLALVAVCVAALPAPGALAAGKPKNDRPSPVIVQTRGEFDWIDAAIGAAAGFGAAVALAGGLTLARNR
jgi:hypothetical protein